VITGVAGAHGRTPAQVLIRWHLQIGNIVIPKSVTPSRIEENFDVFGFELTLEEVAAIDGLDRGERIGPDPDSFVAPPPRPQT
jgi:2,5-diketo-D-gluconate reductase A